LIIVIPELEAVIVFTGGNYFTNEKISCYEIVEEYIIPAYRNKMIIQGLFLLLVGVFNSCQKQENNHFPLAEQYNIDGEQLTLAFDEFKNS